MVVTIGSRIILNLKSKISNLKLVLTGAKDLIIFAALLKFL